MLKKLAWPLLFLFSFSVQGSGVTVVTLSLDQELTAPRWMNDAKAKVTGGALINHMVAAKKAILANNRAGCLTALQKAYSLGKSMGPWLVYNHFQCAQLRDKANKPSLLALGQAARRLEAEPRWLLSEPFAGVLRPAYVSALLILAENQVKTDRKAAWKTIDKLQQVRGWMSLEDRANSYRWAGELAFIEQNLGAAQTFLLRSLNQKESAELRTRVESIRLSLLGRRKPPPEPAKPSTETSAATPSAEELAMSDEEKELYKRMTAAFRSQDFVSAVEDGVSLLQKFPGSKRASEAADRILDIYLSLVNRTEEKFRHVRERIVGEMVKADAGRLNRWANNAYARGNYVDALLLAEKSYAKYDGHVDSTKVLLLAAKAGVSSGEYDRAKRHFELMLKAHGGTPESYESMFRLGLLEYRRKRYSQAAAQFEKLLAVDKNGNFEYRAMHWLWRARQKIDGSKADSYAQTLIKRYPFSYFGLRAMAETNKNQLKLPEKESSVKIEMRLLESERLTWERLAILLRAGWFKEAEREIEFLPEAGTNEELLVRTKLWAAAMRYDMAIQGFNKAIDAQPDLAQLAALKIVFPFEFKQWVDRESKSSGVSSHWILSVIRQESSFRTDVRSPSNALGLMQLLPSTGQELARDLRMKTYQGADSLYNPEINIRLGSYYLARLIRNYKGHVPLALAAYNAGMGRLRRWINARKDVVVNESKPSSTPEEEIWIDELPWDETSFYVKSILRNWLIYRLLDGSNVSLSEPVWVDEKQASR